MLVMLLFFGQSYYFVLSKGGNILREKFTNKLHNIWEFGL